MKNLFEELERELNETNKNFGEMSKEKESVISNIKERHSELEDALSRLDSVMNPLESIDEIEYDSEPNSDIDKQIDDISKALDELLV